MDEPKLTPVKVEKPKGWWNFDGKGSRDGVKLAISKSGIPDNWVITLRQEIDKLEPKYNFISINAHCHVTHIINYHINITPSEMLT